MTPAPRLVFFSMEISAEEAVDLLGRAAVLCSLVSGHRADNGNWPEVQKMAKQFQLDLLAMHHSPGRRLVFCATCGATRSDVATLPPDENGFAIRENPLVVKPEPVE